MKKVSPLKDVRSVEGRKAVEKWVQEMVKPLEGKVEPRRYGDYILPLLTLKRVNDVFEDEVKELEGKLGKAASRRHLEEARFPQEANQPLFRFYIPEGRTWRAIQRRWWGLGAFMNKVVREIVAAAETNFKLYDVIAQTNYKALGDRALRRLVKVLSRYRLGLQDVDPALLEEVGRALRRLAGETLPPDGLNRLLCRLASPEPGDRIAYSSEERSELLGECQRYLLERYGEERDGMRKLPPHLNPSYFVRGEPFSCGAREVKANAIFHGTETQTLMDVRFPRWASFDVLVSYEGSETWWERVEELEEHLGSWGRMVILLNTAAASSGIDGEIRKRFVESDLVEAVVFTPAGLVVLLSRAKRHGGEVLMIEASKDLTREDADRIAGLVERWDEGDGAAVIARTEEIARNGYDLRPGRYVRASR